MEPVLIQVDSSYYLKRARKYFGFSLGSQKRYDHYHVQDCRPSIREVIKALSRINTSTIQLKSTSDPDLWAIKTSAMDLQCIIMEVALNALEAISPGGLIFFKAKNVTPSELQMDVKHKFHHKPLVLIGITDNGTGMNPQILKDMSKPYFTTREPKKRRGLGMTYVYDTIEKIGGFIKVHSFPNVGTVVNLYLPASKKKLPKLFQTQEEKAKLHRTKILIVDNDLDYIAIAEKILMRYSYAISAATSFTEAEIIYKENNNNIDAILIDVSLDNDQVQNFLEKIWEAQPTQKIIATVKPGEKKGNKFLEEYAFSTIIEKPFYFIPFVKSINQVILDSDDLFDT